MGRIVLCVDDDPDDRELIRSAVFNVDPSYRMAFATNGSEAIKYLLDSIDTELPCLIILDINMPGMDGKETILEIKKNPELMEIPVVVFSTSNHPSDQRFCEKIGVELVTKPASLKQITQEAKKLLHYCED
jgi:CheY-like chemotaxis protein